MTDHGDRETTADQLRDAVHSAVKRVVFIVSVNSSLGVLLFLLIVGIRNLTPQNIAAVGTPPRPHLVLHYVLHSRAIDIADLFVLSTAMLGVVAAINIGVAVMPRQDAVAGLDAVTLRSRARAIVWNRSLGMAAYFCALTAMLSAAVGWMSDRLTAIWPSAATLTVIALIAVLVAANVGSLTDDEAERLMDWRGHQQELERITSGVDSRVTRWGTARGKVPRRSWTLWTLATLVVLYAIDLLIECAMTLMYSTTPGLLFSLWLWWRALLLYGIVYTLLGSYFVAGVCALNRWHLGAAIRRPRVPGARGRARWRYRGRLVAIGIADAGLVAFLQVVGFRSHEVVATLLLAGAWVLAPQALCWWALRRGRGPFRIVFERALRARIDEESRLRAHVEKSGRELDQRLVVLDGGRPTVHGPDSVSAMLWRS